MNKVQEKIKNLFVAVVSTALIFLIILSFSGTVLTSPENVIVFVNDIVEKTYIPPPYLLDNMFIVDELRVMTKSEAVKIGYKPDRDAVNQSYFVQDGRSVIGMLLQKTGLLKPLPRRWNEDGTWNW
ncbi:MAG: hypothetical protein KGZ63_11450 [Clostridiales bacterium]|jgi:hypothetical protein|nr:hypothetical protein [Clostridiales bacterium]